MDCSGIGGYGLYGTGQMQKPPGNLEEATDRLIKDKDKDGNGTLNALEICISDEAFQKADANGDGELNSDELQANVQTIGPELAAQGPHGPPPAEDDDEDDDDDSSIEDVFAQADTNGDGVLSAEEFEAAKDEIADALGAQQPQGPPPPPPDLDAATEQLVQSRDSNGNGTLSIDELGIAQDVFDQADTNGDGELSSEELKAGAQLIGPELGDREAALRQYSSLDDSEDDDRFNLTI